MKIIYELRSFSRRQSAGQLGPISAVLWCSAGPQQPLILVPEPTNPVDPNAVLLRGLSGPPIGYLAREDAPQVAAMLWQGEPLLARFDGYCDCVARRRDVYIWMEGEEIQISDERFATLPPHPVRTPETEDA